MKIGFTPKNYNEIIYFNVDENSDEGKVFMSNLILLANSGGEDEADLIIKPSKKEVKFQLKEIKKDVEEILQSPKPKP